MSLRGENGRPKDQFATTLASAQHGSSESLGSLLDACRQYLLLIANQELTPALTAKVGASDLVQDTFLAARQGFAHFRGATKAELHGWLRQILVNHLRMVERQYLDAEKRSARRELSLNGYARPDVNGVCDGGTSPSRHFMRRELKAEVEAALARLPERYRLVIELRNRQGLAFEDVARQLRIKSDAARQLWARAIKRLRKELQADRE